MKRIYEWALIQTWMPWFIRQWCFNKVSSPCEPPHACRTHGICWAHPRWGAKVD